MSERDCEHKQLARSCYICQLEAELSQEKSRADFYVNKSEVLEIVHKNCLELLREACKLLEAEKDDFKSSEYDELHGLEFLMKPEIKELLEEVK